MPPCIQWILLSLFTNIHTCVIHSTIDALDDHSLYREYLHYPRMLTSSVREQSPNEVPFSPLSTVIVDSLHERIPGHDYSDSELLVMSDL